MRLSGVIPPIITPFRGNYDVDIDTLRRLAQQILDAGASAIFAMGTAAESPMLTSGQRTSALETLAEICRNKTPLLVGVMEVSTHRVLEQVREAERLGADAVVAAAPYYFKLKQREIIDHYRAICESTDLPLVIYNLPGHVGSGNYMDAATICEIAEMANVIGYKDSSGQLAQFQQVIRDTRHLENFAVLQGTQTLSVVSLQLGAHGLVPGIGNVAPRHMVELYEAVNKGDIERAYVIQDDIVRLEQLLGVTDYSLAALKAMAVCGDEQAVSVSRLPHFPLKPASNEQFAKLADAVGQIRKGARAAHE